MPDAAEIANENIEHAHEAAHAHGGLDPFARRVAVLVAALAAALAIAETAEKSAQSEFLAHHITLSDDWNFFQTKHVRANLYASVADLLDSLPNAQDPAIRERAAAARKTAARLEDDPVGGEGRKQLMERARHQEELRDHANHRYHLLEYVVSAMQIAIVLASVSVITRVRLLAYGGAALGALAGLFGIAVGAGLF